MREVMTDVMVLVPGFGGSALERDGRVLWGRDDVAGFAQLVENGDGGASLLLDEADDGGVSARGGVRATRVLQGPHVVPGFWRIGGYTKLPKLLGRLLELRTGENCVEFAYDWRRDLRTSARALARESAGWLEAWRTRSGKGDARLVLVAHSMGALVARYFAEALDGWKDMRAMVTFGAPLRGAPVAIGALTGATSPAHRAGVDLTSLLRSFTSVHQLLPVYPCVSRGGMPDQPLVTVGEAQMPGVDDARVALAAELHREIAEAQARHADDPAYRSGHYLYAPVVGTAQSTLQSAVLSEDGVELARSYQQRDLSGDGVVPRFSAQAGEGGDTAATLLTAARHAELWHDDRALSYVLGLFTSFYMGVDAAGPPVRTRVGLDLVVADLCRTGEPIEVRVHPEGRLEEPLRATLEDARSGARVGAARLGRAEERWHVGELTAPAPGFYRVCVTCGEEAQPVSDVLEVIARDA